MNFLNALSKSFGSSEAPTSFAIAMKRAWRWASVSLGFFLLIDYLAKSPLIHWGFDAVACQVNLVGMGLRCKENRPKKSASYSKAMKISPSVRTGLKAKFKTLLRQSILRTCPASITFVVPEASAKLAIPPFPSHATRSTWQAHRTFLMAKIWLGLVITNGNSNACFRRRSMSRPPRKSAKKPWRKSQQPSTCESKSSAPTKLIRARNTRENRREDSEQISAARDSDGLGTEGWLGLMAFLGVLLGLHLAGVF